MHTLATSLLVLCLSSFVFTCLGNRFLIALLNLTLSLHFYSYFSLIELETAGFSGQFCLHFYESKRRVSFSLPV